MNPLCRRSVRPTRKTHWNFSLLASSACPMSG
jgi:hypothetical protein